MNENAETPPHARRVIERPFTHLAITAAIALAIAVSVFVQAPSAAAATLSDLTREEARKLDPLLAIAAEPLVDPAGGAATRALTSGLGPMATVAGVRMEEGEPVADLIFRVENGDTSGLESLGITPDAVVGDVATARSVSIALLPDLARRPEVASVQASRRLKALNDVSVPETRAPEVWDESGAFGATGRGVLIGIIDTGIDWDHPDFQKAGGSTRIKVLLDLSQTGAGPFGGRLFTEAEINQGGIFAPDPVGHGTHVAGAAAGAGRADPAFRGVAPEADLIIVNADRRGDGTFTTDDVINGLSFIEEQAKLLGQPFVANLSLGGHAGAHDGTELEERAIDEIAAPGKPGQAVVVAAGNERQSRGHASADVNGTTDLRVEVPSYEEQAGAGNDVVVVNIWYEAFSAFAVTIITPGGQTVGPFSPGQTNGAGGTSTTSGWVGVQNAVGGASPQNGDLVASILLVDSPTPPEAGTWRIRVAGAGHIDAYIAQSTISGAGGIGVRFTSNIDFTGFIGEPAGARNAITVGAYVTKTQWIDLDDNNIDIVRDFGVPAEIGGSAWFTNGGPTRDGRTKPEIAAPGAEIGAAYSADAPPDSPASRYASPVPSRPNLFLLRGNDPPRYGIQQGTSQASPHVAGAVALLFELHPEWDARDVKYFLTSSARVDLFAAQEPEFFGYGKLDILAAAAAAAAETLPPGDVDGDGDADIADAELAIDFILGRLLPTPVEGRRADMNSDRRLDVGDVVLIVHEALAPAAPPPSPPSDGREAWTVSIAIVADTPVVGIDLALESGARFVEPRPDAVRGTRDGILALGALAGADAGAGAGAGAGTERGVRMIALALDEGDLAGEKPVLVLPFSTPPGVDGLAADWRPTRVRLIGRGSEEIDGEVIVGSPQRVTPIGLRLLPVRPNPTTSSTTVTFDLPGQSAARVEVGIYDVAGRLVSPLADALLAPGRHEIDWDGLAADGRPLAAGIYWVRVSAGGANQATRLTLLR